MSPSDTEKLIRFATATKESLIICHEAIKNLKKDIATLDRRTKDMRNEIIKLQLKKEHETNSPG